MKSEHIKKSIAHEELQLSTSQWLTHYGQCIILKAIPIMFIIIQISNYYSGNIRSSTLSDLAIIITPAVLALWFVYLKKRRLRFTAVESKLSREELEKLIEKVGAEQGWIPVQSKRDIFIATTTPSIAWCSWGEQVTILFGTNCLLINSICDPNKRGSIFSLGRNPKHVERLIEEIEKASNEGEEHMQAA